MIAVIKLAFNSFFPTFEGGLTDCVMTGVADQTVKNSKREENKEGKGTI